MQTGMLSQPPHSSVRIVRDSRGATLVNLADLCGCLNYYAGKTKRLAKKMSADLPGAVWRDIPVVVDGKPQGLMTYLDKPSVLLLLDKAENAPSVDEGALEWLRATLS